MEEELVQSDKIPNKPEKLSDQEMTSLEMMRTEIRVAQAQLETAQAKYEVANLAYKYYILQLYMKYKMTETDSIGEDGKIIKNL